MSRTLRRLYALVVAPILAGWLVVGILWPAAVLVGGAVALALAIGVTGWLVDGDHVTIRKTP